MCKQRSKDLLEPLLEDSDATVGQTWRGSRRRVSLPEVKDVERDLESAVTLESEAGRRPKFDLPKDLSVTGSKSRITPSNAHSKCNSILMFLNLNYAFVFEFWALALLPMSFFIVASSPPLTIDLLHFLHRILSAFDVCHNSSWYQVCLA